MRMNTTRRHQMIAAFLLGLAGLLSAASASAAVTVASIALTVPSKTLGVAAVETLTATAKDSGGHALKGVAFTWTSSNTKALAISTTGVIKGVALGNSTVTVKGGGKSATAVITVTAASIVLTTPNKTLLMGTKETLIASARDAKGHELGGVTFTWASSKATVVSVTARGVATARALGSSKITVTGGGATANVTIKVPSPTSLGGVAAKGAAIAGVQVDLVDKKGVTKSTTTDDGGNYSLDTTGLTPPFLIAVHVDDTHVLYSVSADANSASIINVTPLTDLIIRSWYSVQGVDVADAFAAPVANPPPSPTEVTLISNVVVQVTALWLQQAGVDTTQFSPISTIFAVGDNVDGVLDLTTVNTDTGAITITDGTTTQDSTVTYDTGTGSVSVDTTTTNGTDTSTDTVGTVITTTTDMQAALTGITTALNNFAATVNSKGTALASTDLTPYMDAKLLSEGLNRTQFADQAADQFRGDENGAITISFQVLNIPMLDVAGGLATVDFTLTQSQGLQSQTQTTEFFFKKQTDGSWRIYGDQMPAKLSVEAEYRTNLGFNATTNGPDINVDVRPIKDLYTGITVDDNGGGLFTNTALTKDPQTDVNVYTPNPASPGTTVEIDRDAFFANTGALSNSSLVPAGTALTITMTPATGDPQPYTVKTNAFTNEGITITSPTGPNLADATLDSQLNVEWTLPTTYAIAEVKLEGFVTSAHFSCKVHGPVLSITSTSGNITLPSTCTSNGTTEDVTSASLNLSVRGVNGEQSFVIYDFQGPTP